MLQECEQERRKPRSDGAVPAAGLRSSLSSSRECRHELSVVWHTYVVKQQKEAMLHTTRVG